LVSILSALVWLIAEASSQVQPTHPAIYFWNSLIRFGFFITVTFLLAALKKALEHERYLTRTDQMTCANSASFFYELLQMELDRFQRYGHPFTVAYLDLDNFKSVNDQFGHNTGDLVLQTVVKHTRNQLRRTDVVARMGGDEFVILLPETGSTTAESVISKVQQGLLKEMDKGDWPVTFSTGVITFSETPGSTNELIKMVDSLMYEVKKDGKNAVRYSVYEG
jgi:diguanylate cyclase (GGDEF)-like protein